MYDHTVLCLHVASPIENLQYVVHCSEAQILVAARVDVLENVLRSPAVVVVKGNYSPADPLAVLAVSIHRPTCRSRHCQRGTALQGILASSPQR